MTDAEKLADWKRACELQRARREGYLAACDVWPLRPHVLTADKRYPHPPRPTRQGVRKDLTLDRLTAYAHGNGVGLRRRKLGATLLDADELALALAWAAQPCPDEPIPDEETA